jgi:predicted DCC family thiol-disulfide oxidoreductase YuxK
VASAASARAAGNSPAILFDSDCGFCRWTLGWVLRWDRAHRLIPIRIQSPEGQALLARVDPDARLRSWHLAPSAGEVRSAGAAFPELFAVLPGARPLAALARAAPRLTQRAYVFVAGRRSTFGRLVTAGAKRRADALIEARSRS